MQGTWKTTSGGGGGGLGGAGAAVAVIIGAAVAVKYVIAPLVGLAVEIIKAAFVTAGCLLVLAAIAAVVRWRHGASLVPHRRPVLTVRQLPRDRTVRPVTAATDRAAIGQGDRSELHQHFHVHLSGVSAEADAAAVRALTERTGS